MSVAAQAPQPRFAVCQRWQDGRDHYLPQDTRIDPKQFAVEEIAFREAKAFVLRHHYAGSMPAARAHYGLMHKPAGGRPAQLAGVAVFSVPMQPRVIPHYLGVASEHGIELGRLVLLDSVGANGESWFLARAFRLLAQQHPEITAVVSYCDPLERRRADGSLFKRGHVGTVYQALNARYFGRGSARTLLLGRDGQVLSTRTLSKARNGERGAAYALREIERHSGERRASGEAAADYVKRVLPRLARVRHPGNLVYGFALGGGAPKRRVGARMAAGHAYPKAGHAEPLGGWPWASNDGAP